jgi:hypothetical protein
MADVFQARIRKWKIAQESLGGLGLCLAKISPYYGFTWAQLTSKLLLSIMEAIGAIASIVGVAGAGAKLSIVLFEFASTLGSAGREVRQIGIEISLFCSVLKQLQSTLTKAKAYRYSLSAIETTEEILKRCQEVFKEIDGIIYGLRKRGNAEPSVDLIARVKWTFKRSQVQVLRKTLESCKVTLHLMLSTLDFAQKIATRRSAQPRF